MTKAKLIQCRKVQALKIISIQTGKKKEGRYYSLIILFRLIQVNTTT